MKSPKVVGLRPQDLGWAFDGGGNTARLYLPNAVSWAYARSVTVDPFPAYPHDIGLVKETVAKVGLAAPISMPLIVVLLPFEEPSRTNGWTDRTKGWGDHKGKSQARIVLAGKRIPPHPAMTRYLIAHEYGHVVCYALADSQRAEDDKGEDTGRLEQAYAQMRGLRVSGRRYGGGTWHCATGEVMACDFRLVVTGIEPEFWPHPGIPRPGPEVEAWWAEHLSLAASR